ncbi:glutathione S-transferase family protein [Sulfitobacter donghicola]|uniref:Glutathione S-transferase n=1 Tax=Sulfitobacter donghicola DSW-25 = KCTC 12864 = JCM 14565 TaxID=1300350 RepID=A0A073IYA6_9RHOB|nr:glutathione S-transferase family protein [Sulfitobacter donghicola]KEJ90367.1 glutathione S-transferase [Sulfitobacter donghicola DSW-25 = KCTC 12864 = JCM 14565]KIN67592.1 Glutathione S-transferase protein [Sulfitobacter donghicola DSW-25 = KCTC 12864 = JCM 14565]
MNLFYANGTISIAPAIALLEAGIEHDLTRIDFASAGQSQPEYLAINPKGRVPALVLKTGEVLTETGALLDYIAAKSTTAKLVPQAPETAAHMRSVMYYLASTMHVAHAHKMRGSRWADNEASFADMTAKVPETMAACAAYVESECLKGDYVCGAEFSIADAYLFIVCSWLSGDGVNLDDFPIITAFMNRMEERASVKTMRAKGML